MNINVDVDTLPLLERFKDSDRKIAYNVVGAINDTAKDIQTAERENAHQRLHVRAQITDRSIAKIQFASVLQDRPYAEIYIDQKPRQFLSELETGGERPHGGPANEVAITGEPARPSIGEIVTPALRLNRLNFRPRAAGTSRLGGAIARGKRVLEGAQGTYLIRGVGIFERVSATQTREIYVERQQVELPPDLHWLDTAQAVYARMFHERLQQRAIDALQHGGFEG